MCCPRYILRFATNTRSAGEFPCQPSDPPRRIVSRWATCCPRYTLHFVPGTRSAGECPSQPRCAEPVEVSDFVQRSEAKLYRGGRPAALDTPSTSFQALGQRLSNQANRDVLSLSK